jgi:hypothetical protein
MAGGGGAGAVGVLCLYTGTELLGALGAGCAWGGGLVGDSNATLSVGGGSSCGGVAP